MKTVLIVEDERSLAGAIEKKLGTLGIESKTVASVSEAERVLAERPIDLIWLDHYLLGNEDGLSLVGMLKADSSEYRDIPVVVVSNTASEERVNSYIQFGVEKYYTKSNHTLSEIVEEVNRLLNG